MFVLTGVGPHFDKKGLELLHMSSGKDFVFTVDDYTPEAFKKISNIFGKVACPCK